MCFTVNVNLVKEELENRYGATLIDPDSYRPSYYYHAFALPKMPVICSGNTSGIRLLTWGLIPSATKDIKEAELVRYKTFNARAETLDSLRSFSNAFRTKRCIVPVKGFFEWQHLGKDKIPWYVYRADNDIISLAGLYDDWVENSTGEILSTFSIVTSDANEMMSVIHNSAKRMPVVLEKSTENKWTDLSISHDEAMKLLSPFPSGILKAHTVSKMINSKTAEKNTPEVIKPYAYAKDNLLF